MPKKKNIKIKYSKNTLIVLTILFLIFAFLYIFIAKGIFLLLYQNKIIYADNSLRVHYIDVGQGDCIAINLPDSKIMLIDTGKSTEASIVEDYLNTNVLVGQNDKVIDYMILTHSDADHIGCAASVLSKYEVKNIYRPKIYCEVDEEYSLENVTKHNTLTYISAVNAINDEVEQGANLYLNMKGIKIEGDGYVITFLSPALDYYSSNDYNQYSPIITLSAFDKKFMFTGDATIASENEVLATYSTELDIDVLKVSHHGSDTATSLGFANATSPDYAVISVGYNTYGHPTETVLSNLEHAGVDIDNILTTQDNGNILFLIGGNYDFNFVCGNYNVIVYFADYFYLILFVFLAIFTGVLAIIKHRQEKKNY